MSRNRIYSIPWAAGLLFAASATVAFAEPAKAIEQNPLETVTVYADPVIVQMVQAQHAIREDLTRSVDWRQIALDGLRATLATPPVPDERVVASR